MGPPVDVSRVISRIEEIRGNTRAKIFEAANRLPVSPPILKEIEGQGIIGVLSDRFQTGNILQGKGPILSRLTSPAPTPAPNTSLKKEEKPDKKPEEKPKRSIDDAYSDSGIQI